MASGYPDFTRAVALIGQDPDGNLILIGVDADGRLTVPFKGENPSGDLATVAVDADGQLYAIMRGASGEDLLVDASGFMSAVLKGEKPDTSLGNIALDANGQIISIMKGASGEDLLVDASGFMSAVLKGEKPDTSLGNIALDANGQIISIMKGASGYSLNVDSSGFMTAVLKGISDGVLKTIGLDDDGRISGYLVDAEDQWGKILKVGTAELAARLGSPVSWDRRGQVQHLTDFGQGFAGRQTSAWGGASAVSLDPTHWQNGGYSALLHTAAAANCAAYVGGRLSGAPSNRYGLSVAWASGSSPDFLYLGLKHYSGTVKQEARLNFNDGSEKLYYYNSAGSYVEIADLHLDASDYSFHNMKLVVDFDTGRYVRVLVNSVEYPLDQAVKTSNVPAGAEFLLYRFHVDGYDAITTDTYLDNMIFTVNEP